jgi:hypothetical protein
MIVENIDVPIVSKTPNAGVDDEVVASSGQEPDADATISEKSLTVPSGL